MNPDSVPSAAAHDGNAHDWQALAVLVAVVAVEACLLGWLHGAWMTAYSAFPWMAVPGLSILVGWWWQVARHQSQYRAARVRWPWIAGQVATFAGVLAVLARVSEAPFQTVLCDPRSLLLLAVPATAWLLSSVAAVAPRPRLAGELLITTLACGAFGATTVGISYLTELIWDSSGDTTVGLVESLLTPFADGLRYPNLMGSWSVESLPGLSALASEINRQALMVGYTNSFLLYALVSFAAIPLMLMVKIKP